MRLREIYIRCKKGYHDLQPFYLELKNDKQKKYDRIGLSYEKNKKNKRFENMKIIINNRLGDIKCLESTLTRFNEKFSDDLDIMSQIYELELLLKKIQFVIEIYESLGQQNDETLGLDIKIPETNNITEFNKYISGLEFIFTKCPFFQSSEAYLKLDTVDIGSIWLVIGITGASIAAGSMLLNNIAAFIDKCLIIRSHKLICDRQKQDIENAEIEQNVKEEILKNINRVYKIEVKNVIKELETSAGYKIHDGDEWGRAEQSLEKLGKLLEQGLQIYSSLNSPKEIKALFEPLEMHYLNIEKNLKQIEKKADKRTESEQE